MHIINYYSSFVMWQTVKRKQEALLCSKLTFVTVIQNNQIRNSQFKTNEKNKFNCNTSNVCIVVLYLTSLFLCFSLMLCFLSGGLFYRDAQYLHWIDGSDWPGRFDRWTEEAGERGQTEWVARAVHRGRRLRQKTPADTPQMF